MFEYLKDIQLHCVDTVAAAMDCISRHIKSTGGYGMALVLDDQERLAGIVTDGDIRRALLAGHGLDTALDRVMHRNPVTTAGNEKYHQLLRLFERGIRHIPVVDADGHVVDLILYSELKPDSSPVGTVLRARAPVRISFAGGGTDMTHIIEKRRAAVINATINRYCHAQLIPRDDSQIVLCSREFDQEVTLPSLDAIEYDGTLDLLKAAVNISRPNFGFELYTSSDVPPGSGLGASSAITVAVIGLIDYVRSSQIDEYRIADLAFQAERIELGIRGGWQDQYAAAFGGLNYIEFDHDGVVVHPLRVKDRVRYELESNLLMCFTSLTRNSGDVHAGNQRNGSVSLSEDASEYTPMLNLVKDVRRALLTGNLAEFGHLLDQAWQLKKTMHQNISDTEIDSLYDLAIGEGALGGKLLGAGRGGHLLFYCSPFRKHAVTKAIREKGGIPIAFDLDFEGLRIWPSQRM